MYLATRFFIANGQALPGAATNFSDFSGWIGGTSGAFAFRFPANTKFIRPAVVVNSANVGSTRIDAFNFEPSRCRAGFVPVGDDGVCVQEAIQGATDAITAIGVCKAQGPGAHVCTFTDLQTACGGETTSYRATNTTWPFGAAQGWYGDHGRVETAGNTDDEYLTWNVNGCSNNNDGPAFDFAQIFAYRCCY